MSNIKRKGDFLSKEQRASAIKELISYFAEERDEEIGVIAAENLIDFFLRTCGDDMYRKGIQHSKIILRENLDNLETDLDQLLKG